MKTGPARWLAAAAACALAPAAALAQPGFGQGGPPVRGVTVEVENQAVLSQPDLFASDRICGAFLPADRNLAGVADMVIARVNPMIQRRVSGVQLVRYRLDASRACTVSAYVDQSDLVLIVRLPQNAFETNVTTPDVRLLGADLGLPQGADPRLRVTFDAEVEVRIGLPRGPGQCLRPGSYRARVANISMPSGVNFTGRITGFLLDVATSIYDAFRNNEIGRALGEGITRGGRLPPEIIDTVNRPLCRSGQTFAAFQHSIRGEQLVLALGRGPTIADDRCIDGYIWRQLRPDDKVCVRPETRAQMLADNRLSPERTMPRVSIPRCPLSRPCPTPPPPTGPAPCRSGFVHRAAVADDFACVTPAARDQAQADNRAAPTRRRDYREVIR